MSSVHFGRKPNRKRVCRSLNRTVKITTIPNQTEQNRDRDRSKSRLIFRSFLFIFQKSHSCLLTSEAYAISRRPAADLMTSFFLLFAVVTQLEIRIYVLGVYESVRLWIITYVQVNSDSWRQLKMRLAYSTVFVFVQVSTLSDHNENIVCW